MCQGFRDVINFVWKFDCVMGGKLFDSLFDSYGKECKWYVEELIGCIKVIGEFICIFDFEVVVVCDVCIFVEGGGFLLIYICQEIVLLFWVGIFVVEDVFVCGMFFLQFVIKVNGVGELFDKIIGVGWCLIFDGCDLMMKKFDDVMFGDMFDLNIIKIFFVGEGFGDVLEEKDSVMVDWFDWYGVSVVFVCFDYYVFGVVCSFVDLKFWLVELVSSL